MREEICTGNTSRSAFFAYSESRIAVLIGCVVIFFEINDCHISAFPLMHRNSTPDAGIQPPRF